jgi:autotransporter-associated beta strand protein
MKLKFPWTPATVMLLLAWPAAADVIYSNALNTNIPLDFTGVTINVGTGSLNAFFGGVGVANNVDLQPFRLGTSGDDTIINFSVGTTLNGSTTTLASPGGFGGSIDHLGSTFTDGTEGYVGFKLNGANYGWMRVVFTNNTSGAVVKDWAYDNSGAAMAVGNITTTGSVVTANSSFGDFSVGSVLADVGGAISLVKSGTGTTSLTATNTYTGSTTISTGRLNVNGSTHADSDVSVDAGTTLGGDGVINGNVTLNGILRAGQGGETDRSLTIGGTLTANAGSSMLFTITSELDHDQLVVGSVNLANAELVVESFTDSSVDLLGFGEGASFLSSGASFYKLIDGATAGMFANVTDTMSAAELAFYGLSGTQYTYTFSGQKFWVAQDSTYLVAIPETSVTLLGSLGALLLLRRRR